LRRASYPTSGYSLGSRRTRESRRLLAPRRRHPLAKLLLLIAGFLILGTSALAAGGLHRGGQQATTVEAVRPTVRAAATVPKTGIAVIPKAPPVKQHAFAGTWLAVHPITQPPAIKGRSAVVVDLEAGQILYALDAHARVATASLTKMMTAMIALDLASPDQVVTVPLAATQVIPNHMGVSAGEQLSVRELLDGMLLDSGNDAAETLAQTLIPRDQFIARMNAKAQAMHLHDTHFVNPSGLDEPNQYGSAYDLAVMAATLLLDYAELRSIAASRQVRLAGSAAHKAFTPTSLNRLLSTYPGAIGVKPGYTDEAGYCLAAAASRGGHTIVAVVLGSTQHFTDATALLDFGFRHLVAA
jgi:D-alanyl-D-alanine carboxypeptidase (penicillin-binding protein 5/6)